MGYHLAGFNVVGVDIALRRHYPFPFVQANALDILADPDWARMFDAVHASPPCQPYSITRVTHNAYEWPDLLQPTRDALLAWGLPYVIENVPGAPLRAPLQLCGSEFGLHAYDEVTGIDLRLRRHRLFESNVWLMGAGGCTCTEDRAKGRIGGVYGGGTHQLSRARGDRRGGYTPRTAVQRALLGITWDMPQYAITQAIPPAYTRHIGEQLLAHIERGRAA